MHDGLASPLIPSTLDGAGEHDPMDAVDYDVEVREGRVPVLVRLGRKTPDFAGDETIGAPCFRAMHGRQEPCVGCPVGMGAMPGHAFYAVHEPCDEERYSKRRIERLGQGRYRVSTRRIPGSAVSALIRARVERAFTRSKLTSRERSVVDCLLLGRSVDDIAKVLGLSPHTVKFHKVNALRKLGADSSLDLLRIFVG